jgi:hypothetical protein
MKIYYTHLILNIRKKSLITWWMHGFGKKIEDQYLEISMTPLVLNDVLLDNYV